MAKPPFAVGNKVVSKIKATYGKEGEYFRFLEARGVERTLSEGAVEQYPRRRQRVYMLRPRTCYFHRSDLHACTRKRQAKRPCLGTEEAAEDDGCSSAARRDNIGDESSTDSSNDSDSDSSSSGEDVNAQRWVFRFGNGQIRSMTSC